MNIQRSKKTKINLNIAPLIDVVFLLLIFFMLSYHFVPQAGIKLTLPKAITSKPHQQEDIIIYISKDNQVYLNQERVTMDSLLDNLKTKIDNTEKRIVIIRADENINLGLAVKVMDIVRQAQAKGLVISTQLEEDVQ